MRQKKQKSRKAREQETGPNPISCFPALMLSCSLSAATALLPTITAAVLTGCGATEKPDAVFDLDGHVVDPLVETGANPTVLLFVHSTCPISNRYAPDIKNLHTMFADRGVRFYLVYVDPDDSSDTIRDHRREYDLPGLVLRDTNHVLVRKTGATVTPEAAVYDASRTMVYRGRIDDRNVDFGKLRVAATQLDLQMTLEAIVAGTPLKPRTTRAVGCYIADLKSP